MSVRYWHGGMPGLRVGDLIEPGHERATRDDCPICDARRVGASLACRCGHATCPAAASWVPREGQARVIHLPTPRTT